MAKDKEDRRERRGQIEDRAETALTTRVEAPAGLAQYAENDDSLDALREYTVVPRLKLIQGTSAPELKDAFGEGSVVLTPTKDHVVNNKTSFLFVPLFVT